MSYAGEGYFVCFHPDSQAMILCHHFEVFSSTLKYCGKAVGLVNSLISDSLNYLFGFRVAKVISTSHPIKII